MTTSPGGVPDVPTTAREATATSVRSEPEMARSNLAALLLTGGCLLVLGGLIVAFGYPHTSTGSYGGTEDNGSAAAVIVGAFVVAVAQCFVLVGLIGFGVKLGVTAARHEDIAEV